MLPLASHGWAVLIYDSFATPQSFGTLPSNVFQNKLWHGAFQKTGFYFHKNFLILSLVSSFPLQNPLYISIKAWPWRKHLPTTRPSKMKKSPSNSINVTRSLRELPSRGGHIKRDSIHPCLYMLPSHTPVHAFFPFFSPSSTLPHIHLILHKHYVLHSLGMVTLMMADSNQLCAALTHMMQITTCLWCDSKYCSVNTVDIIS